VAVAERFAEGRASPGELAQAWQTATAPAARSAALPQAWQAAKEAVRHALARLEALRESRDAAGLDERLRRLAVEVEVQWRHAGTAAVKSIRNEAERRLRQEAAAESGRAGQADQGALCGVVRDVLGEHYRPPVIDPAWLAAGGGLVLSIARDLDETGRYDDLPVLADALEEAGCSDATVLGHGRAGRHYRGCWLVDAVLGKG
jgi:hypothetical protein